MKQIFKIDQALKIVTIDSKTKKKIELIYTIVDMDIANRWINLINIISLFRISQKSSQIFHRTYITLSYSKKL